MRAILTMTLNDLRIFFAQPGNWISLTLLPILFTVGLGFAFGGGGGGPQWLLVDVIDHDQSEHSRRLLAEVAAANDLLVLCGPNGIQAIQEIAAAECGAADLPMTLEVAQERVREGDRAALVVIPAGFGAAVVSNVPAQIDFYSTTSPVSPDAILQTVDTVLQRMNGASLTATVVDAVLDGVVARVDAQGGDQATSAAAIAPWRAAFVGEVRANAEALLAARPAATHFESVGGAPSESSNENNNESVQGFTQSVPGVGSMYVMFTVFGGMTLIQRERQRWTLQRLGVFPLTRGQILAGKILTYFSLGMLQYFVVFGVGLAVGLNFGPMPWLILPIMAAFVLCCTALTFAIAPTLHSEGQASVVTQLLSLTFASLGGAWWPLEIVPEFMQRIGHLTPVAWVMDAFRDLIFYGGGFMDVVPEVGVLLGAAAVLFGVGIWRFRYI